MIMHTIYFEALRTESMSTTLRLLVVDVTHPHAQEANGLYCLTTIGDVRNKCLIVSFL